MNDLSSNLISAIVPIAIVALTGAVLALIATKIQQFREQIGADKWDKVVNFVDFIVRAAEQAGIAAEAKGEILDKKKWAIEQIQSLANKYGLSGVDIASWEALIEGAVATYNWGKLFSRESVAPRASFDLISKKDNTSSTLDSIG